MIHLVLLSGGSGTRLWPLSNASRSKQFLKVLRDEAGNHVSMVQRVFGQVRRVPAELDITVATCATQEDAIVSQVPGGYSLVLEPERRDTAPAIMLACAHLSLVQRAAPGDTVIVMPIDTYADQEYYDGIVELDRAVQSGFADLVLLGVEPTYPSRKYGYIVPASPAGSPRRVARFTEKPDEALARDLISAGALWNCGVFSFRLGYLMGVCGRYLPATDFDSFREGYAALPKRSFDYEVVEGAESVGVVPYSGTWKDLGTWNTLTDEMTDLTSGRVVMDGASCRNVHVINETGLPMVVAGLEDAVVVATPDGVLVSGKEASASIKDHVALAAVGSPMLEQRSWGESRVLDGGAAPAGPSSKVSEVTVLPGETYAAGSCRSASWTVVEGCGEASVGGTASALRAGDSLALPAGAPRSVRAVDGVLRLVEVEVSDGRGGATR